MRIKNLFLFAVIALMIFGGSFLKTAEAQIVSPRRAAHPVSPTSGTKAPADAKRAAIANVMRLRQSGAVAGDPCSTAAPINLGQTINGSLTGSDCLLDDETYIDFYSFNGTAGQPVSISMNSGVFDTYLYLLDDAGNIIDENDDSRVNTTDSRIPIGAGVITLPYTGEYILGANSYDSGVTGSYSISVNSDAACGATTLNFNQTVNGTLTASDCGVNIGGELFYTDLYQFNGTAGQQISILQTSTAIDSYLILHTPSGDGSLEDDNSGGGNNARIPESGTFTLPETGVYTIEASSNNSFETGAYVLTLTGPNTPTTTAPNTISTATADPICRFSVRQTEIGIFSNRQTDSPVSISVSAPIRSFPPTTTATAKPTSPFIVTASGIYSVRPPDFSASLTALPETFLFPPISTATAKLKSPFSARQTEFGIPII